MNDELSNYKESGYTSPIRVMLEEEAARLVSELERIERRLGPQIFDRLQLKGHLLFPFLWDLVHDERIVERVEAILGPDILCWGSSFFIKEPGAPAVVPWHQDGTCWGLDEPWGLTAWLALTPSTPETGCLRVLPGSHRAEVPHEIRNAPSSMLPLGEEVSLEVDEQKALHCPLRPGEMSLHHMMLIHGSAPNGSPTERRIGFAIRYIAGDARQRRGETGYATLVRGRDHGTFQLESRPQSNLEPGALRRHRQILSHSARLVMREAEELIRKVR